MLFCSSAIKHAHFLTIPAMGALKRHKRYPALCPSEMSQRVHKVAKLRHVVKHPVFGHACPVTKMCMGGFLRGMQKPPLTGV